MEIDLGIALCVVTSSAAGWYAGHYFERQRARAAFARIAQRSMESTTGMLHSAIAMFEKYIPAATESSEKSSALVEEYIATCNSHGLDLRVMKAGGSIPPAIPGTNKS